MLIGIDGNEANVEKRVGIGEYSFQLLKQLKEFQASNFEFQIYLKDNPLPSLPKEDHHWKYKVIKPGKLWTQWRLPLDLYFNNPKPDVFFSPSHYAPRFSPVKTVVSVMDLSYLYFPELFKKKDLLQLRAWTSYSVKNAKKVFTISNSSKNDIIREYNLPSGKVVVTHLGIKEVIKTKNNNMDELKSKYGILGNYMLFVGTLQPRKNIRKLIEAFSRIKDLDLVVVGKKGWLYEEILSAPKEFGVEDRVKFLENIGDDELPLFYKNAICFVFPSLYEGFGLPVLEAMNYDCPVITSNISSLPEAGGDACLYVDPENVDDITEKMKQLIKDKDLRKKLISKGREQVEKFSWEKTAKETLKVLEEVANN